MKTFLSRIVSLKLLSQAQGEGVGATVRRSIGRPEVRNFDPFLMLDEFRVGPPAGFPDHPHRGFETVTYMIDGAFAHEDFCGHRGLIEAGDLQWMTAGRGIVHSEMPATDSESHGLQLWVNLRQSDKLCDPAYQELKKAEIPVANQNGIRAIVIAGSALGITSPVQTRTPTHYIHFFMDPSSELHHPIPTGWNAFVYVLQGEAVFGGEHVSSHHLALLSRDGEGIEVQTTQDSSCSFVLLSGEPIGEPIVQYGPFVMNTDKEVRQAMKDYDSNRNGFERADGWYSEIGLPITHADRDL